jgi:hypothetical protein
MKRIIVLTAALVLIVAGVSYAEFWQKSVPVQEKVVTKAAATPTAEIIAQKKAGLNNTEWAVDMKPMSGKGKAEKDTLSFVNNKISSKNLSSRGYPASNFSCRILEDGETFTWETMQNSEKEGIAFWRGDIGPDGIMRGVLSIRDKKNNVSDFNFLSTGVQKVTVVAPPAETKVEPTVPPAATK